MGHKGITEALSRIVSGRSAGRSGERAASQAGELAGLERVAADTEEEFRELILALASELQLRPLLHKIMAAATRLLDADRSTLFLYDDQTRELWSPVAQGLGGREIRFSCDLGIAGSVYRTKNCINIPDAYGDDRFNRETDKDTGYRTKTILCCPVVNKQGRAIGAIQALNKRGGPFSEQDALRLTTFAAQASMAIENAQLYNNLEEKVHERTQELHDALGRLSSEMDRAAEYVKRLIPAPMQEDGLAVDWRFLPCAALGGDAFGYHWLDPDHFAVYLIDVSGHGVGAALLSVSITNVLRSHTLPGVDFRDPVQVLAGLNQAFPMEEHNFMFFTMWYGVYNPSKGTLTFASGGHPPALLLSPEGCRDLRTPNPLMGSMLGTVYTAEEVEVRPGERLFVYSDGCYEITRRSGRVWTLGEFREYMSGSAAEIGLDDLVGHARQLGGREEFEDDFSICEVRFG